MLKKDWGNHVLILFGYVSASSSWADEVPDKGQMKIISDKAKHGYLQKHHCSKDCRIGPYMKTGLSSFQISNEKNKQTGIIS